MRQIRLIIAVLALLAASVSNADLMESVFSGAGSFYNYATGITTNGDIEFSYLYDTDDAPVGTCYGYYCIYDDDSDWLSISVSLNNMEVADEDELREDNDGIVNDYAYVYDYGSVGSTYERWGTFSSEGYGNDATGYSRFYGSASAYDYGANFLNGTGLDQSFEYNDAYVYGYAYFYNYDYREGYDPYGYARLDYGRGTVISRSVPEPGTLALLGIGLFGMGLARRNKKA